MTDYFALFQEPRRPWLEPEALKATFLALAAAAHPDKQPAADPAEKLKASRRYAELNAAYHCLTEPKLRLLHLLELITEISKIKTSFGNFVSELFCFSNINVLLGLLN